MSQVESTGQAVGKLVEAQKRLWEAANFVSDARLSTVAASQSSDFVDTQLGRQLNELSGVLSEVGDRMDGYIRDLAQLIPAPAPSEEGEDGE